MRQPVHCVIPPYIAERLARSPDPRLRRRARADLVDAEYFRAAREAAPAIPGRRERPSGDRSKTRRVHDARGRYELPGDLVRSEGAPPTGDAAADEAYEYSGATYDFYHRIFGRRSLDGEGMPLVSSVHVGGTAGEPLSNAFWNGEQMAYGDGDGRVFRRFTCALEVVGHELAHGVQAFTSRLEYRGESGSLNEHFADVFGVLVRHWREGTPVDTAHWLVGAEVLIPASTRRAIRDMEHPGTAFHEDPDLGSDPQPAHMRRIYRGPSDRGGVHINSGIPNRAFVLAARSIGGKSWETAGRIWYAAMLGLHGTADFADCARLTTAEGARHGPRVGRAVRDAWAEVGLAVSGRGAPAGAPREDADGVEAPCA